jgi:protein-tyrosine-phosphatase
MSSKPIRAILFACNMNKVRSPMAAALARAKLGSSVRVESCGLQAADAVDPFAVAVMAEAGFDLESHEPQAFGDLAHAEIEGGFDLLVILTPEAKAKAGALAARLGARVLYWNVPDPTLVTGAREQRLDAYRETRDRLRRELEALFP